MPPYGDPRWTPQLVPPMSKQLQDLLDTVIKNGKPAFQTLILGFRCRGFRGGTCACPGAPLLLLRDSGSEPNRLGLSGQGRQGQRVLPQVASAWPQAPEDLSGQLPPGVLHRRPRHPQRQALSHWIGPGPRGKPPDPPGSQPGGLSLTPSLSLRDRLTTSAQLFGYGTRPGPNRVPARAPLLQPRTRICTDLNRPLAPENTPPTPNPPTEVFTSVSPDGPTVSEPRLPSPAEAGDYILIGP